MTSSTAVSRTVSSTTSDIPMPNTFTCTNAAGDMKITYHPCAWGPLTPGENSPVCDYQGKEGNYCFIGQEVLEQDGPFGRIITVDLTKMLGAGAAPVTMTFFLPTVNMPGAGSAAPSFQTCCVRSQGKTAATSPGTGAQISYQMMPMQGTAACLPKPLVATR